MLEQTLNDQEEKHRIKKGIQFEHNGQKKRNHPESLSQLKEKVAVSKNHFDIFLSNTGDSDEDPDESVTAQDKTMEKILKEMK